MIVAIIQAHLASTRLPRKITRPILGQPMLAWVVRRARRIPEVSRVVVAASKNQLDQWIVDWCRDDGGVECIRGTGEERDVLTRYEEAAKALGLQGSDLIVRITSDCQMLDPVVSHQVIRLHQESRVDYASNLRDWPDGLCTEVFTRAALQAAYHLAFNEADREHVTPWMRRTLFCVDLPHEPNLRHVKVSVDTEEDLEYLRELSAGLGPDVGWEDLGRVQPGQICKGCAAGTPHLERAGTRLWDLHQIPVAGGRGLKECRAWQIMARAASLPRLSIGVRTPDAESQKSRDADQSSHPDGADR